MTPKQIADRLVGIRTALVEKIEAQPFIDPSLKVTDRAAVEITLYRDYNGGEYTLRRITSKNFADALSSAEVFIARMPDPADQKIQAFQKRLARLIDEGLEISAPTEVMTMLRGGMDALSENLLTQHEA